MNAGQLHVQFLENPAGRVLITVRRAAAGSMGVLIVPPFAEEMNKSRRMIAEVAVALAGRGVSSVSIDLYGTGDSEGEFADANLARWMADLTAVAEWSAAQGIRIQALIGVRLGCLLAAQFARTAAPGIDRTVFWQPVLDGSRMLDQFLRLRVAAQMMGEGPKETISAIRERLRSKTVEIAGYEISPQLAADIDALRFEQVAGKELGFVHWVETVRCADTPVSAPSARGIEALRKIGCDIAVHTVTSDPFWTSTEIVTSAALVDATVRALCEAA